MNSGGGGGDGGIIAAATAGVSARIAWIYRSPHLRGDSHRKLDVLASPGFSLPQGLARSVWRSTQIS